MSQEIETEQTATTCEQEQEIKPEVEEVQAPATENRIIYRCQQCRAPLFTNKSIIPHQATKTRKFLYKRDEAGPENECTSFFIQQPPWLDATGRMADTIYCPKCHFKVGHFNWKGAQCSCGEWVKPSFQIPKSRVDSV